MKVIGTAGHIDHGKSALVRGLTGIDPDRLSEEKQRGMTIDLGFAWITLPSGAEASIIDVPGHERFVRNMLAGAGGIDVALLVVAADEGVMPQTREHLDILDLLQVKHGVVALTKVDLVDNELRDLMLEDVANTLSGTGLRASPIVPVSSVTREGFEQLLQAVDAVIAATPEPVDLGVPYLPVDRVFTLVGFGTVVTGTLHNGRISAGQEVQIIPGGRSVRIRSLQTHRKPVEEADPGSRIAANLSGVSRDEIERGDVLALPGTIRTVQRVDVRLRVLSDAAFALPHGSTVTVHIGAAERQAVLTILDGSEIEPGASGWAQLRFSEPVAALRGQRFIVRLPSPARTVGGGEIVDVAPRHRRRDSAAPGRLALLHSPSVVEALAGALASDQSRTSEQLATLLGVNREDVAAALYDMQQEREVVVLGDAYLSTNAWAKIEDAAISALKIYHSSFPLRSGMPREELRSKVGLSARLWTPALKLLVATGILREEGTTVALPNHRGGTFSRREEVERVLSVLRREPYAPPNGNDLLLAARTDQGLLAALADEGEITSVGEGLYFEKTAYQMMVERTREIIETSGEVTVASFRDAMGTSRKYALTFLEHLDNKRITQRVGDARVLGSKAASCG